MISAPIRLLKYTTIRLRIHSNQVTFLPTTSMTIRQLPVKSSPPTNTMIISPTGKMIPATNRARPTLSIACAAVLLVAPPSAMKAPAIMPNRIILPRGRCALPSPAFMLLSMTSAGVLKCCSIFSLISVQPLSAVLSHTHLLPILHEICGGKQAFPPMYLIIYISSHRFCHNTIFFCKIYAKK